MFLASSLIVFAISIYRILHQKSSENVKVLAQLHHAKHTVSHQKMQELFAKISAEILK